MKKLILSALITLALTLSLPTATALAKEMTAVLPDFDITLNGVTVDNQNRQYPFLVFNDITYFPMTYYDCRFLGIESVWDDSSKTLTVTDTNLSCAYRNYASDTKNGRYHRVTVCDFGITVNGITLDNSAEQYPLLTYRGVTYFPLTWRFTVDEFGWSYYNFDTENGLVINSDNHHTESVTLPGLTGAVAYDGVYYIYNAAVGENNYIYAYNNAENYYDKGKIRILHQLPFTNLSRHASFVSSHDGIYAVYTAGTSPIMSSARSYEVKAREGILTPKTHDNWFYGNHGYSEYSVRSEEISVRAYNPYFDSATEFSYTIDGETVTVPALEGRIRVGAYRDGKAKSMSASKLIKIYGDKIYYTAADLNAESPTSNLYVIDTKKGISEKLIDGVCGFAVYNGWSNELYSDSTMILFDNGGITKRYTEKDGKIITVDNSSFDTEGLVLDSAVGGIDCYAVYQAIDGSRTVIKRFRGYAQGNASGDCTLFETKTGTNITHADGKLVVNVLGESPDDSVRLLVLGNYVEFRSCDVARSVFLKDNVLVYSMYDNTVAKVYLK